MPETERVDMTYHDLHPDAVDFNQCEWHILARRLLKREIKGHGLDVSPCPEEGTEQVDILWDEYLMVCPKHKRDWDGVRRKDES